MNGKAIRTALRGLGRAGAVALALALASCGGGGGGQVAGIDRLGVSSGTVTGFGSVFVNGVEWQTSSATITVDDAPGTESDLAVGQVVTVRGTLSADGTSGNADSIDFSSNLVGPITVGSINTAAGSFAVLGRTVLVSADTEFDDSVPAGADGQRHLDDLQSGDLVEVSGYFDSTGAVRATRIEIRVAPGEYKVKGSVSNADPTARTFRIGSLDVDCSVLPSLGFTDGAFVEVEGNLAGNVLVATKCSVEDGLSGSESGHDGELEGYIGNLSLPGPGLANFTISGVAVAVNGSTQYSGGSYASLANDLKVEVEGRLDSTSVLVAGKVEFRVQPADTTVELEGNVNVVNAAAGTVTLQGMNVVVGVNAVTRLEDKSSQDVEKFSLANLSSGDHVEIRGAPVAGGSPGSVLATRLERQNAQDEVILRGPVQAVSQPELTVLGVTVDAGTAAFPGSNSAAFFQAAQVGTVVKATTTLTGVTGNVLTAIEVEIAGSDD